LPQKKFSKKRKKVILHGTVNHFSDKNFHILVKYDIGHEGRIIYLGSIFYKIVVGENMVYKINELGRGERTTGDQSVLNFISIYKSVLNLSSSDKSFSRQMINKIENIAKENGCLAIYTSPIGKMVKILEHYGFERGKLKTVVYDARRDSDDEHYFNTNPFNGLGLGRPSRHSSSRHTQKRKKQKTNGKKLGLQQEKNNSYCGDEYYIIYRLYNIETKLENKYINDNILHHNSTMYENTSNNRVSGRYGI